MTCDEAKEKFDDFKKNFESIQSINISESDTRSKLIDNLFINVLGWNENDIVREGHVDSGFYDYKISIAGLTFIVEAKKQFVEFSLPIQKNRRCKIGTLISANKDVIEQIRRYLADCGCDTGIITNGKQFIISKFINVNGISWKENKCIIYNGIDDIERNFIEFWNTLSKESIIKNKGFKSLFDVEHSFFKTILSSIPEKDNEIVRNDLSSKIASLIDKSLGDIFNSDEEDDDLEFIRECYVENKEVIKNKNELRGLFRDDAPSLSEVIKARNADSVRKQINEEIESIPILNKMSPTPKPIIIIGSRGAGKTTFLKFLLKDQTDDQMNNTLYLFINLMKYYSGNECIDFNNLYKDLLIQFNDKYPSFDIYSLKVLKRIYIKEINQNDKGLWKYYKENEEKEYHKILLKFLSDKTNCSQEHFKALNIYLTREIHKRILIVFDNADQLSDKIQESVYLNACALNTQAKFGVIISLREGYYYNWRNRPPFNAFVSNAYHIAAPDYGEVLQKRLNYIIKNIQINNQPTIGRIGNKNVELTEGKIEEFFTGIKLSLFSNDNGPILDFLRQMSFPNIREGLSLFKTFLISGYTDVSEYILRVLYNTDNHAITIPIHEFVKTIGLENKMYYNHKSSKIQNIFYPASPNSDYFIKYYILRKLDEQLSFDGNINKYISYRNLVEELHNSGYKEDILNQEIEILLKDNFIETDKLLSDISWSQLPEEDFAITITAKGHYYITELINKFYYIELVLQDTPFIDKDKYNGIKCKFPIPEIHGKKDMKIRIKTVCLFMEYLKECEDKFAPIQLCNKYGKVTDYIEESGLNKDIEKLCNIVSIPLPEILSNY